MRKFAVVFVSTLFPFSLLTLATQSALASDPDTDAPADEPAQARAVVPPPPPGAVLVPVQEEPPYKSFAIIANPLAIFIGRYSVQFEYLPALHHALTLNPFYTHAGININGVDFGTVSGGGAELGYKFYTGRKGPNGFFVGPSILFGTYSQSGGVVDATNGTTSPSTSFINYGGAIDLGGQAVVGPGIVIGGGFGLQWTKNNKALNTKDFNTAANIVAGGGTWPRFLFTLGYAF